MLIQGQVGPVASVTSLGAATQATARMGQLGDLVVSELQGRYYELAYRRQLFRAANSALVTSSAGLSTTYVGCMLSNPVGNAYNLVVLKVGWAALVAWPAAAAVGLCVGYNSSTNVTHTTPLVPASNFVGVGPTPTGLVDSSATLPTAPVYERFFGIGHTGALTVDTNVAGSIVDIDGSIILPPGGYCGTVTSTASGASGFFGSILWAEIPV